MASATTSEVSGAGQLTLPARLAVGGREREEQVAAVVVGGVAHPAETDAEALRERVELVREERRVGRGDADDRATPRGCAVGRRPAPGRGLLPTNSGTRGFGTTSSPIRAPTSTPLIRSSSRLPKFDWTRMPSVKVPPPVATQARRRADPGLEPERDHAGAATDASLLDRAPRARRRMRGAHARDGRGAR